MSEIKAPPTAPEVWRCETCKRPMQCQVCGSTEALFTSDYGLVCWNHLRPAPPAETRK